MKLKIVLSALVAIAVASCGITRERDGFGGGFGSGKKCQEKCGTTDNSTTKVESKSNAKDFAESSLKNVSNVTETIENVSTPEVTKAIENAKTTKVKQSFSQKIATKMAIKAAAKYAPAKIKKSAAKTSGGGGMDNETLIAILLCIFVGGLGIHRFYLGYNLIGLLQLLTAGGCGIWVLIDLIRLITGDLEANTGDPWSL